MKKGNLNLSINSIVVLILAITMLGLGLAFMRNIFGDAMEQFEGVSAEMETEMTESLRDTRDDVALNVRETSAEMRSTSRIYLGIQNDRSDTLYYQYDIFESGQDNPCDYESGETGDCKIDLDVFNDGSVEGNDVEVIPITFEPDFDEENEDLDNQGYTLFVCEADDRDDLPSQCHPSEDLDNSHIHGIVNFYVTV